MNSRCEVRSHADVVIVGAGLAGLTAALTASRRGKSVTLLAFGAGALSIGSGCVDLLGYVRTPEGSMQPVSGPVLDALDSLPAEHPYSLMGKQAVREALDSFTAFCAEQGLRLSSAKGGVNHRLPTIMGTLKPSWLCPPSADPAPLFAAQRIVVAGIEGIKDCQPGLILQQLRRYPALADKDFSEAMLLSPFGKTHRNITPLDVARFVDTPKGQEWCVEALRPFAHGKDCVLLPPICGSGLAGGSQVWQALRQRLGCELVEMLSIPPGVGGLRLRNALLALLRKAQVRVVENVQVTGALVEGGRCSALIATAEGKERAHEGSAFIIATGGVQGGGIATAPGKATETIFGLPVDAPTDPAAWSAADIFGAHPFACMGVKTNARLAPVDAAGEEVLHNVHFAGRSLAGYDFAAEKSGNGVALVTGWHAAQQV